MNNIQLQEFYQKLLKSYLEAHPENDEKWLLFYNPALIQNFDDFKTIFLSPSNCEHFLEVLDYFIKMLKDANYRGFIRSRKYEYIMPVSRISPEIEEVTNLTFINGASKTDKCRIITLHELEHMYQELYTWHQKHVEYIHHYFMVDPTKWVSPDKVIELFK